MALPDLKKNSRSRSRTTTRHAVSKMFFVVLGVGCFCMLLLMFSSTESKVRKKAALIATDARSESLRLIRRLAHEDIFEATLKTCIPAQKPTCNVFEPEVNGAAIQRIAIISSPSNASILLYNNVNEISNSQNRNRQGSPIELISRSHVPPYGYGETHGLTKIIRLIPNPLVLEVTTALLHSLEPGETYEDITLTDLKSGLRQILRYHGRLSAVAAHTALLSIPYADLAKNLDSVIKSLEGFVAPRENQTTARGTETDKQDRDGFILALEAAAGAQLLNSIQLKVNVDLLEELDNVLLDELKKTKNLTSWPCPSFWAVGDDATPTSMSPLLQRLAKQLSPDCDDPIGSCWVPKDKCESIGDGACE
jgi:hypothetical protein